MRELYEADFHKPGVCGSGRVWANSWDVFRRMPSRSGRGRRAAVDFVVDFGCGGISFFFSFFIRIFNAHGLLQVWGRFALFTSLLVMRQAFFSYRAKTPLHTGVRTGLHRSIGLSVCLCYGNASTPGVAILTRRGWWSKGPP